MKSRPITFSNGGKSACESVVMTIVGSGISVRTACTFASIASSARAAKALKAARMFSIERSAVGFIDSSGRLSAAAYSGLLSSYSQGATPPFSANAESQSAKRLAIGSYTYLAASY